MSAPLRYQLRQQEHRENARIVRVELGGMLLSQAKLLHAAGKQQEAADAINQVIECQEKLLSDFPTQPDYVAALGRTQATLAEFLAGPLHRPDEARQLLRAVIDQLTKLVAQHPKEPRYRLALAHCHSELGTLLRAADRHAEAIESFQNASTLLAKLAEEYPSREDYKGALAAAEASFRHAIEVAPNAAAAHLSLAQIYIQTNKLTEATVEYQLAVRLAPNQDHSYELALLLLSTGQIDGYRQLCQEMLDRNLLTENLDIALGIGVCCKLAPAAVTDYAPVLTLFKKALEKNPGHRHILAHLLLRSGQTTAAVKMLEEIVALNKPESIDFPFNRLFLSMAKCRLGRRDEARKLLSETVQWIDKNGQEKLAEGSSLTTPLAWPLRQELAPS